MTTLAFFALLLVVHYWVDFSIQHDFIAKGKNPAAPLPGIPWYHVMFAHALHHGGALGAIVWLFTHDIGLALALGTAEVIGHFAIDWSKCTSRLGSGEAAFNADQALHLAMKVVLGLIAVLAYH